MCGLMVKLMIQYLNGILMTLKLIYQIKATQGITGLIYWIAHIKWMVWHLDVGLSFPKSVGSLIGGSAHPITRYICRWKIINFKSISWFKRQSLTFMILKYRFNSFRDAFYTHKCVANIGIRVDYSIFIRAVTICELFHK